MTPASPNPVFDRQSDALRAKFSKDVEQIRSRNELTQAAKNARIAAVRKTLRVQMAQAEATSNEARKAARAKNERIAFGLDDLAGDKATITIAHRAALDKVATIKSPVEAAALLARARTTGDETMVRAIALHAHSQVSASAFSSAGAPSTDEEGWQDVLGNAASSRPQAIEAINALQDEARQRPSAAEVFEFAITEPIELGRATTDAELDRIIAQDPSMGVVR